MRWTQENEQILLRTIFATQDIHLNLDEIAEAWPGDEKPTPKALSEQLHKYRKNGNGTNKVTFSGAKRKADDSGPGTPRKRASPKKASPKKASPKKGGKEAEGAKAEGAKAEDDAAQNGMVIKEGEDGYA